MRIAIAITSSIPARIGRCFFFGGVIGLIVMDDLPWRDDMHNNTTDRGAAQYGTDVPIVIKASVS